MDTAFDISDGRNRYEPCPSCDREDGMGLVALKQTLAVQCFCGHRGPEVEVPPPEQWSTWPVP